MCCRTPVIASNVTSLPEIVGDAGILVDPLDEAAIAGAMQSLLGDTELREGLAQAGFERSRQFTWEHCAEGLVDAFRSILNHETTNKPG
jgi:glycosyltransferase involved in cell wall biosynthesis